MTKQFKFTMLAILVSVLALSGIVSMLMPGSPVSAAGPVAGSTNCTAYCNPGDCPAANGGVCTGEASGYCPGRASASCPCGGRFGR